METVKEPVKEDFPDLTSALGVWAKKNNITPKKFKMGMGWSYNYEWRVLRDKGDKFQPAAWGAFIMAFGLESLAEIFKIAGVDLNKRVIE